jgi:hypothetical protein
MELQWQMEALKTTFQEFKVEWKEMHSMQDIMDEYNQEEYVWYDFEADCDDWYMDSCHLWDDNHFHLLFDDSTPPHVECIFESTQEPSLHIILQFYYSLVVVDEVLVGSTYFDPHDQYRSSKHHFQLVPEFQYLQRAVHMSTWTWDPSL